LILNNDWRTRWERSADGELVNYQFGLDDGCLTLFPG
jgi:hypothetical protein